MYLQPLRSSSSTVTLGAPPVVQLRLPPLQQAMDIGNLLNNKSSQPVSSRSPSAPLGGHTLGHHLAPGGYHSHASSVSEANFDARSTVSSEFMASYSPQSTLSRPPALSPAVSGYSDPSQYNPHLAGSEPPSTTSHLPYDPIEDNRSRAAAAAAAAAAAQQSVMAHPGQRDQNSGIDSIELPKAFHCSTCTKGFARRSDLVRHERIHSGVRPHVCQHAGCGKQFIQRSALTVHERVHTKEKPHQCEKCGKPFSDSSSLARHRRIHSGTRPYQCPYADCQKTFTRRTTLTRHQNHHTGTVEEAEAARAAALASRASAQTQAMENAQPKQEGTAEPGDQSDTSSTPSYNPYIAQMASSLPRGFPQQDYYAASPAAKGGVYPPPPRPPMGSGQADIKNEPYAQASMAPQPGWPYPPNAGPTAHAQPWDHVPRPGPDGYTYQPAPGYPAHR